LTVCIHKMRIPSPSRRLRPALAHVGENLATEVCGPVCTGGRWGIDGAALPLRVVHRRAAVLPSLDGAAAVREINNGEAGRTLQAALAGWLAYRSEGAKRVHWSGSPHKGPLPHTKGLLLHAVDEPHTVFSPWPFPMLVLSDTREAADDLARVAACPRPRVCVAAVLCRQQLTAA
jgi:hypothetical protein